MDERVERASEQLQRMRQWYRPDRDRSLSFVGDLVKKQVTRPHQKLGKAAAAWSELIPEHLLRRTALARLRAGVLTVYAADDATRYELDCLLRSGVQRNIQRRCKASVRRIKVQVGPVG